MALPEVPFDACDQRPGRVSSQSLVRYRNNDYSVPGAYAHREIIVKGYVDDVVVIWAGDEIARHRRSCESADFVFNPLHYLPLLEEKVGALDQAAPLQNRDLPEEFATLRRLFETRLSQKNRRAAGKREFVQVLRLMEDFPEPVVHGAVKEALRIGALSADGVRHLVLASIECRPARLDTERYPHGVPRTCRSPSSVQRRPPITWWPRAAADGERGIMSTAADEAPEILLRHHLKKFKLPTVLRCAPHGSMRRSLGNAPPRGSTISAISLG